MKRIICHPVRLILQVFCLLVLLAMVILYLVMRNYVAAMTFGALLSLSAYLNMGTFCTVRIDDDGITKTILGLQGTSMKWSEVKEAGVIYTNHVRRLAARKNPGSCSLYVSPRKMTSEERLKASLDWPPKDVIEMTYTPERMREISLRWEKKWTLFNITSRELFRDEPILLNVDVDEIRH